MNEERKNNLNSSADDLIKIAFIRAEKTIKYPLMKRFMELG